MRDETGLGNEIVLEGETSIRVTIDKPLKFYEKTCMLQKDAGYVDDCTICECDDFIYQGDRVLIPTSKHANPSRRRGQGSVIL